MADLRTARCRPGLRAALAGGVALAGSAVLGAFPATAQIPPPSGGFGGGLPGATAPGGSPGATAPGGSTVRLPGMSGTPTLPGAPDPSRFWLPQLYPGLPGGPGPAGAPGEFWVLQPSIEVQLAATDNVRNSSTDRESDLYTVIRPQITLFGQSARLSGSFSYAPSLRLYLNSSDQNRLDHALAARGTATLIEDFMFLDVSGTSDARSVFGGFGQFGDLGTNSFDSNGRLQTTSYRISPYVAQRFGGVATARVGYAFTQSFQDGDDAFLPGQSQPFFTSQDLITHEFFATVASGEDWGRLGFNAEARHRIFDGTGVYEDAHATLYVLGLSYQLTREFAVTGDIGWQDEQYSGASPVDIQEPVWGLGFRLTPDPDSVLSVRYGQRDGFESFSVNGGLMVGVRTRLVLDYREELGASFRPDGGLGPNLRVDQFGNIVDAVTGLPVSLSDLRLLASQNAVFRTRRGTAALSQVWPRDTLTVALTRDERDPVSVAQGTTAFAQDTLALALAWSRELEPGLSLSTAGRIGWTDTEGQGDGRFYSAQVALARAFTPSLAGTLQYQFTKSDNTAGTLGSTTQNTIILSLRQLF